MLTSLTYLGQHLKEVPTSLNPLLLFPLIIHFFFFFFFFFFFITLNNTTNSPNYSPQTFLNPNTKRSLALYKKLRFALFMPPPLFIPSLISSLQEKNPNGEAFWGFSNPPFSFFFFYIYSLHPHSPFLLSSSSLTILLFFFFFTPSRVIVEAVCSIIF